MALRKSNSYIFDVEVKLLGDIEWSVYVNNCPEVPAKQIAIVLAGNPNVLGVRISKWFPAYQLVEDKVYKDTDYKLAM